MSGSEDNVPNSKNETAEANRPVDENAEVER
jgi:hypothetical protein